MAEEKLKVAREMVVSLTYVLTDDVGVVIDRADADDPVIYLHGAGEIIPGLEDGVYGMTVGEERAVVVQPADAYGDIDQDAFDVLDLDMFPDDIELEEGLDIELTDQVTGEQIDAWVQEIHYDDKEVVVSFNHPMAGQVLYFHVKVVDVRPATAEEIEHGHAHDDDYHQH